jgi:Holliday junction resolvase RusA-like endonuclease
MRIEIPCLPPPELRGNARTHWAKKYQASQALKALTIGALMSQYQSYPLYDRAIAKVKFIVATKRRRDGDNWLIGLKPVWDALVWAKLLKDDDAETLIIEPVTFEVDEMVAPMMQIDIMGYPKKLKGGE